MTVSVILPRHAQQSAPPLYRLVLRTVAESERIGDQLPVDLVITSSEASWFQLRTVLNDFHDAAPEYYLAQRDNGHTEHTV